MGFFGKLFDKKVCDLCGEEIGLLGNRKLEDGNCCKECAKKLSPWFDERRHSTVEEIRQQLDYREENKKAVADFKVTRSLGGNTRVLVDENTGKFMVTAAKDYREVNPDVVDCSQVTAVDVDVDEDRDEVFRQVRDAEGKLTRESYSPRRYRYKYSFRLTIRVNHPYFDDMHFSLSDGSFEVEARNTATASLFGFRVNVEDRGEGSTTPPTLEDRRSNVRYARCEEMGKEIRQVLMNPQPKATPADAFAPLIAAYRAADADLDKALASGDLEAQLRAEQGRADAMRALNRAAAADMEGGIRAGVPEIIANSGRPRPGAQPQPQVQPQVQPEPQAQVTCPWCGSKTKAGRFCQNCGGQL